MVSIAHPPVIAGAEPFWLPASKDLGCLLIHGFTGSPAELRGMGERLQQAGVSALGIRLPGHGTSVEDLERHGRRSWLAAAQRGLAELLTHCEHAIICGMSMGGTITLNVAAATPDPRILGLAVMAAPVRLLDLRYRPSELLLMLQRWRDWGSPDIKDREQWKYHIGYRTAPVSTTVQLVRLVHETYERLPDVQQPVLVMHSRDDHTVPPINVHWMLNRLGSTDREIVWFQNSYHVMSVDYESESVARRVVEFARRLRSARQ